ncbi:hypothetical protein ACQPYK_43590 [Streptosporangium sp. CA-135522]|uniref:hypothetical protein n=1 Tax=Streptosporangium sp. CA-135522 TaxID=3240072 RepID=UPI003D8F67D0
MRTEVYLSVLAEKQAEALRGADLRAFVAFVGDLEARGCAALGYRLTGEFPVNRLCVKHLRGAMRVVVAFEGAGRSWVLMMGPHDERDRTHDVYASLWGVCGLDAPPVGERTKPACCDGDGAEPNLPEIDDLTARCRDLVKTRRRKRAG